MWYFARAYKVIVFSNLEALQNNRLCFILFSQKPVNVITVLVGLVFSFTFIFFLFLFLIDFLVLENVPALDALKLYF